MAGKRQVIAPPKRGKRYVRRTESGEFTRDQTSVGRSLAQDRRRRAQSTAKPGYGDQGDRERRGPRRRGNATRSR